MSDITNIQEELRTLIAAHPYFENISVVADDFRRDSEMELGLNRDGLCIAISEVISAQVEDQTKQKVSFSPKFAIKVRFKLSKNASLVQPRKATAAVQAVIEALLEHMPAKGEAQYKFVPEGDFLHPASDDEGLASWVISVQKRCTLSGFSL